MTEERPGPEPEDPFVDAVKKKAERMSRARKDKTSVWVVLAQAGAIGWQFALPLVACTLAGRAIARAIGHDGPALAGIAIGLGLGLVGAARSLKMGMEE